MKQPALTDRQLDLVKRTVAGDCNADEFSLFMEAVRRYGLDPFRRQIMALVFSKHNPQKRRMSIVVGLDGQRVLAQRCGDYRPASEPAVFEIDDSLKSDTNPDGIVSCTVYLHKQDNKGNWYPVAGQAWWNEFAPLSDEWAENAETGRREPTGRKRLDANSQWMRMPRIMIQKCATMQALRAGWPDEFSGIYAEEEMHQAVAKDMDAAKAVEEFQETERLRRVSAENAILVQWLPGMPLENVPTGQFADRVVEWIEDPSRTAEQIESFRDVNREGMREFWAAAPNDALELKKVFEQRERNAA